jgi:hypothetical protein
MNGTGRRKSRYPNPIRKSANATITLAFVTIIRGKWTLLMGFKLLTILFDASLSPVEKNVHGNMPANTISR